MAKTSPDENTIFAVDFATLAREIAQDIFSVEQIVALHRLTDEEWLQIQSHPRFTAMLHSMQVEWNSAQNTRERVRVKAQTGLESQLEVFIRDINDPSIPLAQRVDAGRFLARLGELDGQSQSNQSIGSGVTINIVTSDRNEPITISAKSAPAIEHEQLPVTDAEYQNAD
jgi:hypothetical protein